MSSIISGYEYDIFISYRQKDNKGDHWVTEFVNALKIELEATFKEDISIYFDENPHDGLLETYDVDDSLKDKINCFIFIPIISQTYCDPRSFAWKNEFLAFRKLVSEDQLGLKVKLINGNVASRILPISIYELDAADKLLIETELGGTLRGVEFIYRSAGVLRPLKANEEDAKANLNHTFYRDQLNKVARAIKELTDSMQHPNGAPLNQPHRKQEKAVSPSARRKIALVAGMIILLGFLSYSYYYFGGLTSLLNKDIDKSIAVLPFENLSNDPEQEYFSNGITEDILNHLVKIADLRVKSRTSTLQYKGKRPSVIQVGEELGVANVVEGSVRRVGNTVRIVVQLIDAKTDVHLWSETYDRDFKDILALQSEIAIKIANALEAHLTAVEKKNIQTEATKDITAYDYFLKARDLLNRTNEERRDYENALLLLNEALQLDSIFSPAYAAKGSIWLWMKIYGVEQKIWQDSSLYFSSKAITLDPSSPDGYLVEGNLNLYLGRLKESMVSFQNAYNVAPNNPTVLLSYGLQLLRERNERGADLVLKSIENQYSLKDPEYYLRWSFAYRNIGDVITREKLLKKAKNISPGSVQSYLALSYHYWDTGQYDKGILELRQAEKINPTHGGVIDNLAWLHYLNNDLTEAAKYWLKEVDSPVRETVIHRLGMVYSRMGLKNEADALFLEDLKNRSELSEGRKIGAWGGLGGAYYVLAIDNAYFGKNDKAVQYLDSAHHYKFIWFEGYDKDPMFSNLRDRKDYKMVIRKVDDDWAFMKLAYSNAINRMEGSKELKNSLK